MRKLILTLLVISFSVLMFSVKIHQSELSSYSTDNAYLPDVAGYINVKENHIAYKNVQTTTRNLPEVFPGYPVSYSNSNTYNGAIYVDIDDDDETEIIFGVGTKIVALELDGTDVTGWPVNLSYYIWGSPAYGDIDGDGAPEVVATSRNNTTGNEGELYAFNQDGSTVDGFPVVQAGGGTMNAALADITDDGQMEILVNVRNPLDDSVYVYDGSGEVVEGWPQELDTFPGAGISCGDINNDGLKEVVALSYESLHVYDNEGNILDGFPLNVPGVTYSYSAPVLVDLDGDETREIVYGGCSDSGGGVYIVNHDGSFRDGWPQNTENWVFGTVSIADLNNDEEFDIVVGDQVTSAEPANYIYAWDKDGNSLAGFPAGPTDAIYTQIGIADLTGDSNVNLVISSNVFGFGYDCYNHDGTHNDEWPLPCGTDWSSMTMQTTPVFGDFDQDGNIDMAGASTGFSSWLVEIYLWETEVEYNSDLAYMIIDDCNVQHNGWYQKTFELPTVANPVFSPEPDSYDEPIYLEILCDTEDAEIYYTLDGTEPTALSNLYEEPVYLDSTVVVKARAFKDDWNPSEIVEGEYTIFVNIDSDYEDLSGKSKLLDSYPNPLNLNESNNSTVISYVLSQSGHVELTVFDIRGRKIRKIVNNTQNKGKHTINWSGRDSNGQKLSSGVYLYKLKTENGYVASKKMLIIK